MRSSPIHNHQMNIEPERLEDGYFNFRTGTNMTGNCYASPEFPYIVLPSCFLAERNDMKLYDFIRKYKI